MIAAVIKTDFREAWRDHRLPLLLVISLLLALAATWTGAQRASNYEHERQAAISQDTQSWNAQGAENPHTVAHFGHFAFKPLTKLATFDPGLTPYLGSMIWMEAHWQDPAADRSAENAPEAQRFADLTPAWLLQIIAPLAIILIGFPMLARERDTGLWRSIAAVGVSPIRFFTAKALSLGCLSLLALSPILAAAVLAPMLSNAPVPADESNRVAGLVVVYALYLLMFVGVSLAVSAWSSTANRALAALVGIWIITVLIAPKLAVNLADIAQPLPDGAFFRAQMEREIREGIDESGSASERVAALEKSLLDQYGVDNIKQLPVDFDGIRLQANEDYDAAILDRHFGNLYDTYNRQREPLRAAAIVSPTLVVQEASAFLAGVDELHHRNMADAAERHRREIIRILNGDQTNNGVGLGFDYIAPPSVWAKIPEFSYAPPTMRETNSNGVILAVAIMAIWIVAAAVLAVLGVRRWSRI